MKNVDDKEIEKFDALAEEWWDPNGSSKFLHQLNPLRLQFIESHSKLNQSTAIDIGCGGGLLSEALVQAGSNVTAIDMSEKALAVAKQHADNSKLNINYELSTAENYAEKNSAAFDIVTCMELLEHVPDPQSVIQACADLCKPGGQIFFSTINRSPKAYLATIIGAEYLFQWLPRGTHEYKKFIKPSELKRMADQAALELINIQGLEYKILDSRFAFSSKVDINYLMGFTKPNE